MKQVQIFRKGMPCEISLGWEILPGKQIAGNMFFPHYRKIISIRSLPIIRNTVRKYYVYNSFPSHTRYKALLRKMEP